MNRRARRGAFVPAWIAPGLTAALLAAPRLTLGYYWDDYHFLTSRGTNDPFWFLVPRADDPFYRPIPEALYAQFLKFVDPRSGFVGHAINLGLWVLSIALLVQLVSRLAGRRPAILAGFAFAATGAVPSLVAWVSGSHDLFAIVFILAAMLARDAGRNALALASTACALLSKESAIAFLPVLCLWNLVIRKRDVSAVRDVLPYGVLILGWAAIHPAIRPLAARGFHSGATGYVGLEHPERWALYLARYFGTLWNVPASGTATHWPADLTLWACAAFVVLVVGFKVSGMASKGPASRDGRPAAAEAPLPTPALLLLAAMLSLPALLLPTLLVRPWVPYLVTPSALGASLALGIALARLPGALAPAVLAIFLALGVWCRGLVLPGETVWSEPVLVDGSRAVRRVEANFRTLHPTLPRGAQVLVSVAATGQRGINATLIGGQALSVWYGDPSLRTARPELRRTWSGPDMLFRVTEALDVVEIEPDQCLYRSTAASVSPFDIGRPISTYARGVAASGDPKRSVRILERLAQLDQGYLRSYDLRIAAMAAAWSGDGAESARLLASADSLPREAALDLMAKVFGEPTSRADLDSCAYRAFGISPDDPGALRHLVKLFVEMGYTTQAEHFAGRLRRISPTPNGS